MRVYLKTFGLFGILLLDVVLWLIAVSMNPDPETVFSLNNYLVDPFSILGAILWIFVGIALQVIAVAYFGRRELTKEARLEFYPEYRGDPSEIRLGHFSPEKLTKIVNRVEEKTGKKVKKGYISIEVLPRQISYYLPPPWDANVLIIGGNLLSICTETELEAALVLEFTLFNSLNSTMITFLNLHDRAFYSILGIRFFYPVLATLLYTILSTSPFVLSIESISSILMTFFGFFIIALVVYRIADFFIRLSYLNMHYIGDAISAMIIGKNPTINFLIKLGQRSLALDVLLSEIKWLEGRTSRIYSFDEERLRELLVLLDPMELSEEVAKEMAPRIFLFSKLQQLAKYHFELPKDFQDKLVFSASKKLLNERNQYLENLEAEYKKRGRPPPKKKKTVDWRQYDVDGNLTLDDTELANFVSALKSTKGFLFENEFAGGAFFKRRPPVRKRIIKLYEFKM
ncbi:MAG TPA: hypothetical protein VJ044_04740 [Candidatus Hodarchaeales archaeon]|nr:hypothetical protein [Candidatus Hodarchaeales archaeon]